MKKYISHISNSGTVESEPVSILVDNSLRKVAKFTFPLPTNSVWECQHWVSLILKKKKKLANLMSEKRGTQISLGLRLYFLHTPKLASQSAFSLSSLIDTTTGRVREGYKI